MSPSFAHAIQTPLSGSVNIPRCPLSFRGHWSDGGADFCGRRVFEMKDTTRRHLAGRVYTSGVILVTSLLTPFWSWNERQLVGSTRYQSFDSFLFFSFFLVDGRWYERRLALASRLQLQSFSYRGKVEAIIYEEIIKVISLFLNDGSYSRSQGERTWTQIQSGKKKSLCYP